MAIVEYPSWVYDPTGKNPPTVALNDEHYVQLLTSPVPDPTIVSRAPTAMVAPAVMMVPVPKETLVKVAGVTQSPSNARIVKTPIVKQQRSTR